MNYRCAFTQSIFTFTQKALDILEKYDMMNMEMRIGKANIANTQMVNAFRQ